MWLRLWIGAYLVLCVSAHASSCKDHLQKFVAPFSDLASLLLRIEQRTPSIYELAHSRATRFFGWSGREIQSNTSLIKAINPNNGEPIQFADLEKAQVLLLLATQFEINTSWFGPFGTETYRRVTSGDSRSDAALLGFYLSPEQQAMARTFLSSQFRNHAMARPYITDEDSGIAPDFESVITSVHLEIPYLGIGNFALTPASDTYKLLLFGGDLQTNLPKVLYFTLESLVTDPRLKTLEIEVLNDLAWVEVQSGTLSIGQIPTNNREQIYRTLKGNIDLLFRITPYQQAKDCSEFSYIWKDKTIRFRFIDNQ